MNLIKDISKKKNGNIYITCFILQILSIIWMILNILFDFDNISEMLSLPYFMFSMICFFPWGLGSLILSIADKDKFKNKEIIVISCILFYLYIISTFILLFTGLVDIFENWNSLFIMI